MVRFCENNGSESDHNKPLLMAMAIKGQICDDLSRNREEKESRRRRKEGCWQQKFQGLLSAPSQIAEKGAWEGSFSQIADIQDFVLNLEEREEGEGERKVASDNELNFR
ncbi:hypothetical protein ACJW31_02G025000 [Castanea mollissima]